MTMTSQPIDISVVIPCYNSEKALDELFKRLFAQLSAMVERYEVICVNDGSRDATFAKLRQLSEQYPQLRAIDLMFNVGQFRTLMCGLEHARGRYVITMDDDLQHPPEELPKLYGALLENDDVDAVLGVPEKKEHAWYRNVGSAMYRRLNEKIFKKPRHLRVSAFRCMRRELVETLLNHKTYFPVMGPLILRSTRRIINVTVAHHPRKHGSSNYSLLKLVKTTVDNIVSFSSLPLKYMSYFGIFVSLMSFVLGLFFLVKYLAVGIDQPGWTSLVLLINFYAGVILLSLGVIGEYLVRILAEVNGYPRYVVRCEISAGGDVGV